MNQSSSEQTESGILCGYPNTCNSCYISNFLKDEYIHIIHSKFQCLTLYKRN